MTEKLLSSQKDFFGTRNCSHDQKLIILLGSPVGKTTIKKSTQTSPGVLNLTSVYERGTIYLAYFGAHNLNLLNCAMIGNIASNLHLCCPIK